MRASASLLAAYGCALILMACGGELSKWDGAGKHPGGSTSDCSGASCASAAPPIDWSAGSPSYTAHVRVVNPQGDPVKGASVQVGGKTQKTDADGRVAITGVNATTETVIKVNAEESVPYVARTDPSKCSQKTQDVPIVHTEVEKSIKNTDQATVASDGGKVTLPGKGVANKTGQRVTDVHVSMTSLNPKTLPAGAFSGSAVARDRAGNLGAIDKMFAALHVQLTSMTGEALNLAEGVAAEVELEIPAGAAKPGDHLGLFSLNEDTSEWGQESECVVAERKVQGASHTVCQGLASHFSTWAVATSLFINKPASLGCVNVVPAVAKDACFKMEVETFSLGACDTGGANCAPADFVSAAFVPDAGQGAYCGVMKPAVTQRVAMIYNVDASACPAAKNLVSGRRVKTAAAFDFSAFKTELGSDLMLAFNLDTAKQCKTLCQQVAMTITEADLTTPVWHDGDNDGFYADSAGDTKFTDWSKADCDDTSVAAYPGAPELFCSDKDQNCDGKLFTGDKLKPNDVDYLSWNRYCKSCPNAEPSAEVAKNYYDENCDGIVEDRDGDGFSVPQDCNDFDPNSAPGKTEIVSNWADEDCDGVAIDRDGDGMPATQHIIYASKFDIPEEKYVDCNDGNASVNPARKPNDEAGVVARYFYDDGGSARRSSAYCLVFDAQGHPLAKYFADLNCDGVVTDIDGDGYAATEDPSSTDLPKADCNDYDPRIHPSSETANDCGPPPNLVNDQPCKFEPKGEPMLLPISPCKPVSLTGLTLTPKCQQATNPDGTPADSYLCSYDGWQQGNPLTPSTGIDWGPCDGNGSPTQKLDACPMGSTCGGPVMSTAAFDTYLQKTYNNGKPLDFKGMCFPTCNP